MSTVQYVLVADAARARLLQWNDARELEEVETWLHPKSRLQNRELVTDAPGRNAGSPNGPGSAAESPDAHRVEAERFALRLAEQLRAARVRSAYEELVVVAPPKFLGMLREALDTPTARTIVASVPNDFTNLPLHELGSAVRRHLEPEARPQA